MDYGTELIREVVLVWDEHETLIGRFYLATEFRAQECGMSQDQWSI